VILNLIVSWITFIKTREINFSLDILIDYNGQLKLSDFGAAKILAKGQKTMGRTTVNMNVNSLAGTPMYMVR
jgi:serine/threonine protein kinase